MYIAVKWLLFMAMAMWIGLCLLDLYKRNMTLTDCIQPQYLVTKYQNMSVTVDQILPKSKEKIIFPKKPRHNAYQHYLIIFIGASIISILNKKYNILMCIRRKINTIDLIELDKYLRCNVIFKNTAICVTVAFLKIVKLIKAKALEVREYIHGPMPALNSRLSLVLLNKLRTLDQERKNLVQLLIAAIHENKLIKMKYQLESMAKNRLTQHVNDSHKQIRENRTRSISFQQLYLIARQENIFLKARVKRLAQEKEIIERNLIEVINKICLSKNNDIKTFCNNLIINLQNNLLNSNVRNEIDIFLQKYNGNGDRNVFNQETSDVALKPLKIMEIIDEDQLTILSEGAPKFRGLPGEYVWTVKDKDGIIEKLYEYDTGFDNGDTVRRIREYSVYCDKECLLDFSNSTTLVTDERRTNFESQKPQFWFANHNFLTGSQAFRSFLRNNKNFVTNRLEPRAISYKI